MAEPIYHPWTPRGGLNQDDSILTPSPGLAGSLFEDGDYRYARNVRINSTRGSNAGDIENIRGTLEVTDYYVKQLSSASEQFNDLDAWSIIDFHGNWAIDSGAAKVTLSGGSTRTDALYKPLTTEGTVNISVSIRAERTGQIFSGTYSFTIIFTQGANIVAQQSYSIGYNQNFSTL